MYAMNICSKKLLRKNVTVFSLLLFVLLCALYNHEWEKAFFKYIITFGASIYCLIFYIMISSILFFNFRRVFGVIFELSIVKILLRHLECSQGCCNDFCFVCSWLRELALLISADWARESKFVVACMLCDLTLPCAISITIVSANTGSVF